MLPPSQGVRFKNVVTRSQRPELRTTVSAIEISPLHEDLYSANLQLTTLLDTMYKFSILDSNACPLLRYSFERFTNLAARLK